MPRKLLFRAVKKIVTAFTVLQASVRLKADCVNTAAVSVIAGGFFARNAELILFTLFTLSCNHNVS